MVRGRSRDDVQYIFVQLGERLKRATEWLVRYERCCVPEAPVAGPLVCLISSRC